MSDATVSPANVKLLINGNLPSNMLSYVVKQAISGDQVMYCMAIRNSVLLQWYNAKSKQKKYVDFLNEIIPDGSVKIKSTSLRVEVRLRHQCCNVNNKVKRLNSKGSKEKRVVYLNEMSKVSILVSDVATAVEMEQEIKSKCKEIEMLHKRLENLNVELEEWKKQYQNLEKEIERLFFEMKSEKETQISNLVSENEEMKKYVRKLEKGNEGDITSGMKNIGDLSKRQQNRRLQALGTRAQKALWFAKRFGLELDRLEFLDNKGQIYGWSSSSSSSSEDTSPVSLGTPSTANSTPQVTPNNSHSTSSSPTATPPEQKNQYDKLSSDSKCKVEAILFLMDKFAVGDAFIHELSMIVDGMPRSYLIKQCRNKLNSICAVKPTPGPEPGAQLSFKDSLVNKL